MVLILASSSAIRRQILAAAGVEFDTARPDVDEDSIKRTFAGDDAELARALAEAKAQSIHGASWAIGSDSVVSVDGRRFSKPKDRDQAAEHLRAFSGRTLMLTSAVALARDGRCDWSFSDEVRLHVRELSDRFIAEYLDAEWPEVGYCVGVFRLEARGVQLFDRIEGDHFTILGMPLLPLLGALRERGLVPA